MYRSVSLCRGVFSLFLVLLFLASISCSSSQNTVSNEDSEALLTTSFFHEPSPSSSLDVFYYEWILISQTSTWRLYYGLAYQRWQKPHPLSFSHLYFLLQPLESHVSYPQKIVLQNQQGKEWHFNALNQDQDLTLAYHKHDFLNSSWREKSQVAQKNSLQEEEQEKPLLTKPPFKGRVYIAEPTFNSLLDWGDLRRLYEEASTNEKPFRFLWEYEPMSSHKVLREPDRAIFGINLPAEAIQTFMATLKKEGIS